MLVQGRGRWTVSQRRIMIPYLFDTKVIFCHSHVTSQVPLRTKTQDWHYLQNEQDNHGTVPLTVSACSESEA